MTADQSRVYDEALTSVKEGARPLTTLSPLLQGIYFAAVSMSDLKKVISGNLMLTIIFVLPIVCWLISLWLTVQVFVPPLVLESQLGPNEYKKAAQTALRYLRWAQWTLIAGLFCMVLNIIIYFAFLPAPPQIPATQ